jgi:nucleoid-associated protein YgaU
VIADEVAGSLHLPVEMQRQLPIALPHQVLYGCYLDAGAVRLILNVEALAVHFEKTAVRDLVASLSPDIVMQPEHASEAPEQMATVPPAAGTGRKTGEAPLSGQEKVAAAVAYEAEPAPAAVGDAVTAATIEKERMREEARLKAAADAAERELAIQRVESERLRAEDEARSRAAEQARLKAEAVAKALEKQRLQEEAEKARSEAVNRARAEAEAQARMAAEAARQEAEEAGAGAEQNAAVRTRTTPENEVVSPAPAVTSYGDQRPAGRKKGKLIWAGAMIAVILVFVIYSTRSPVTQVAPPVLEKAQPQDVQKPPPPRNEAKQEPKVTSEDVLKSLPKPETMAPLYLTVPPDRVLPDQTVYIVVKGDTLWGIAKRFTGNPLNYPRVAKDNSIATPDLIFPGQRIRLVQEIR